MLFQAVANGQEYLLGYRKDAQQKSPIKYADAVELKHVLNQIVVYRASLELPWSMRGEESILAENALGRLCITDGKAAARETIRTVVDESFVFLAAYNFIRKEDDEIYKHFTEQYEDLEDPRSDWEIFEHHALYDLIYAYYKKQLKQELFSIPSAAQRRPMKKLKTLIPQFEHVSFPRRFFEHPATISGWHDYKLGYVNMETFTMESSLSGPDIVVVLRIDDQLYPVFVHNKPLHNIFPGYMEKARPAAYETRLKAYLPNLATYSPGGKYLSLIYDQPAIVKAPREGWNSGDVWDSEPEIETYLSQVFKDGDMPLVQLMVIDGNNMRDFVSGGVMDLLDSVKNVKRVHEIW